MMNRPGAAVKSCRLKDLHEHGASQDRALGGLVKYCSIRLAGADSSALVLSICHCEQPADRTPR